MIWIFISIFCAGMTSLLLELSLLREFVYIFGSTATTNAVIISVFLVGLVAGSYLGTWKRLVAPDESRARRRFYALQLAGLGYIVMFFFLKNWLVYECTRPALVVAGFLVSVLVPSFISGLCYSYSVKILHPRGEKWITYIYAVSTLGSVVGGLAHGLLLVPLWGMRSAYLVAVVFAWCSAFFMMERKKPLVLAGLSVCLVLGLALVWVRPANFMITSKKIVYSKDSQFGIVEVWQISHKEARKVNTWLGAPADEFVDGRNMIIDMRINKVHQSYNLPVDRRIHEQWADISLAMTGGPAKVLLLGYGSGVTAAAFARSALTERVDMVENCDPIIEAAALFFPEEYRYFSSAPNARMVVDDLRGYARFASNMYDIIALDHSIQDPYQIGYFTVDFFRQLKSILKPGGVVMLLGSGLSWNTTRLSFSHIYRSIDPAVEKHIRDECLFLRTSPMPVSLEAKFRLVDTPVEHDGAVFTDEAVRKPTPEELI